MQRVLFRHKFIAFWVQHQIYHKHRMAFQHFNCTRQSRATVKHDQRRFGIRELDPCNGRQIVGSLGVQLHSDVWSVWQGKLRPFSRRQHEHRRIWLNHQLTTALKWWLEILSFPPSSPRVAPCRLVGVRGRTSDEGFMGARRSTGTGSARWFLFPTHTWEPLLLT